MIMQLHKDVFFGQTSAMALRQPDGRFDAPSLGALVQILLLLPMWLLSLAAFWWPLHLLIPLKYWVLCAVHGACGIILLSRPIQQWFLLRLLGARWPTHEEHQRLAPLYQDILGNKRFGRTFAFAVTDSDEFNAFASGGNLVIVTTGVLYTLPDFELKGVLAHEIGHHASFVSETLVIGYWFALPVFLFARFGLFLENVATAARETFTSSTIISVLGAVIWGLLRVFGLIFQSGIVVWQFVGSIVSRYAEFQADAFAVKMGFGPELAAAMRQTAFHEPPAGSRTREERLFGSHPPLRTRLAKVEALTRRSVWHSDERYS
jgi:Zn-dependent protease with chaperone function